MVERLAALRKSQPFEFFGNKQPICPHCGSNFDITANEAWHLFSEDETHDVECNRCEMDFLVSSRASWTFDTEEQDDT